MRNKPEETGWRVWNNSEVASRFTETRRGGMPGFDAQHQTLMRLIEFVQKRPLAVLDIGCGDGILMQSVMKSFPVARAVAMDGSPAMLEKAEVRFESLGLFSTLVEFVLADFSSSDWLAKIGDGGFDVIVSGFAIHHVEDDRKQELYREIFGLLSPGGVFVNIEHVASRSPRGEELFERTYAESVAKFRNSQGATTTPEEVYQELLIRPDKAANRLSDVGKQVEWLERIGFDHADCFWKQFELAIFGGYKPGES